MSTRGTLSGVPSLPRASLPTILSESCLPTGSGSPGRGGDNDSHELLPRHGSHHLPRTLGEIPRVTASHACSPRLPGQSSTLPPPLLSPQQFMSSPASHALRGEPLHSSSQDLLFLSSLACFVFTPQGLPEVSEDSWKTLWRIFLHILSSSRLWPPWGDTGQSLTRIAPSPHGAFERALSQ